MTLRDRLYGEYEITSPILVDLITSKPMQRLKGIAQFGVPDAYYHLKNYSRYEHCIGVMLLLRSLGASEEEQIAGLLHDVSHTAFSHVVDWVVGDGKTENYQDNHHESYIISTEIPEILKKHGYIVGRITDYHHFGLLERELPDICADRIDYSLREFTEDIAKACFEDLITLDNKIVFRDKQTALLFATNYLQRQKEHWGGFEAVSRYRIFADALRIALKEHTLHKEDFWEDDAFVVKKITKTKNSEIHRLLDLLKQKSLASLPKGTQVLQKKFRYVDPLFLSKNKLFRLSDVTSDFAKLLQKARVENDKGIVIPEF